MFNTGLGGDIPDLSNLQSLEVFKVENCNFSGDGWTTLFSVPTIIVLGVAGNEFVSGTLDGIGNLVNLQELYIAETSVGGTIPEEIGNLSQLKTIKSKETAFTGPLPAGIGGLVSLKELDFEKNQLTGALPEEIGGMVEVLEVYLQENRELEGDQVLRCL